MLLILNESGVIAGIDTTTFGYMAIFSALILYLSGGMLGIAALALRSLVPHASQP